MTLYGIKTCDTCRKALKALEAAGKPVSFLDVRVDKVAAAQLSAWYGALGPDLVNRRSTTWKGLAEDMRAGVESAEGAVALLAEHPTLMKRPVIEAGGAVHLGWTKPVQAALLG